MIPSPRTTRRHEVKASRALLIAAAVAAAHVAGCGQESTTPARDSASARQRSLDARLLQDLDSRQQWRTEHVKFSRQRPEVRVQVIADSGAVIEVHAWTHNDFRVPMMRIESGELLYELTPQEFEELLLRSDPRPETAQR